MSKNLNVFRWVESESKWLASATPVKDIMKSKKELFVSDDESLDSNEIVTMRTEDFIKASDEKRYVLHVTQTAMKTDNYRILFYSPKTDSYHAPNLHIPRGEMIWITGQYKSYMSLLLLNDNMDEQSKKCLWSFWKSLSPTCPVKLTPEIDWVEDEQILVPVGNFSDVRLTGTEKFNRMVKEANSKGSKSFKVDQLLNKKMISFLNAKFSLYGVVCSTVSTKIRLYFQGMTIDDVSAIRTNVMPGTEDLVSYNLSAPSKSKSGGKACSGKGNKRSDRDAEEDDMVIDIEEE